MKQLETYDQYCTSKVDSRLLKQLETCDQYCTSKVDSRLLKQLETCNQYCTSRVDSRLLKQLETCDQYCTSRVDSRLLKQQEKQHRKLKKFFAKQLHNVKFLAKQGLPFRGLRKDKMDFSDCSVNRGNIAATMQLNGKDNATLLSFSLQ